MVHVMDTWKLTLKQQCFLDYPKVKWRKKLKSFEHFSIIWMKPILIFPLRQGFENLEIHTPHFNFKPQSNGYVWQMLKSVALSTRSCPSSTLIQLQETVAEKCKASKKWTKLDTFFFFFFIKNKLDKTFENDFFPSFFFPL